PASRSAGSSRMRAPEGAARFTLRPGVQYGGGPGSESRPRRVTASGRTCWEVQPRVSSAERRRTTMGWKRLAPLTLALLVVVSGHAPAGAVASGEAGGPT